MRGKGLRIPGAILLPVLLMIISAGCVRRTLTVTTDPPGALVFLNGVEAGRSPLERDFTYYGTYDVAVRKDGYETLKTKGKVIAPWWQWVPFDFFAEFIPLHDRQTLTFTLYPVNEAAVDPHGLLARGEEFGTKLQSSEHTRAPTTRVATTQRATTRRATTVPSSHP